MALKLPEHESTREDVAHAIHGWLVAVVPNWPSLEDWDWIDVETAIERGYVTEQQVQDQIDSAFDLCDVCVRDKTEKAQYGCRDCTHGVLVLKATKIATTTTK